MLNEKNETMGAMLVCLAATLWGFDSIVLTPRLFKLSGPQRWVNERRSNWTMLICKLLLTKLNRKWDTHSCTMIKW